MRRRRTHLMPTIYLYRDSQVPKGATPSYRISYRQVDQQARFGVFRSFRLL